jgi:hypothetical protein
MSKSNSQHPKPQRAQKPSWQIQALAEQIQFPSRHFSATQILNFLARKTNDAGVSFHGYESIKSHTNVKTNRGVSLGLQFIKAYSTLIVGEPILTWVRGTGGATKKRTSVYKLHLVAMQKMVRLQGVFDENGRRKYSQSSILNEQESSILSTLDDGQSSILSASVEYPHRTSNPQLHQRTVKSKATQSDSSIFVSGSKSATQVPDNQNGNESSTPMICRTCNILTRGSSKCQWDDEQDDEHEIGPMTAAPKLSMKDATARHRKAVANDYELCQRCNMLSMSGIESCPCGSDTRVPDAWLQEVYAQHKAWEQWKASQQSPAIPVEPSSFLNEWRLPSHVGPNVRNMVNMATEILTSLARRANPNDGGAVPEAMVSADAVMQSNVEWLDFDGMATDPKQLFRIVLGHLQEWKDIRVLNGKVYRLPYVPPTPLPPAAPRQIVAPALKPEPSCELQRLREAAERAAKIWRAHNQDDQALYCTKCDRGEVLSDDVLDCPKCGPTSDRDAENSPVMTLKQWCEKTARAYNAQARKEGVQQ